MAPSPAPAPDRTADLEAVLAEVAEQTRHLAEEGRVQEQPEELPSAEPTRFGLALAELDGTEHVTGDADVGFAIQSVVKVFALTAALRLVGEDLFERVGREPSGDPFNSLIQLEHEKGVPRNPFINAGALVVCDVLLEAADDPYGAVAGLLGDLVGEEATVDRTALEAEREGSSLNQAIGHLMSSFGNVHHPVEEVVELYVRLCSITVTTRTLARAARFLADDGVNPLTGAAVLSEPLARRVNALMLTCGTYDAAGQFAYDLGFPCKSGVAGAVMGDVTGRFGVCAWSPPLDEKGNSRAGRAALHLLSERLDLSLL
ncbi:glutaminase A [Blastococcus sp. KM273128]|uniref:glutaminase A n=1 Tax=Blastococcus sp. KM273128 TaxID=2570314 RepID=UPI001F02BD87|nr:glutaminase A [Blastococcus sp. KM273128]MCF6743477.1 glutaminase A [Blastococcus sp. KM273128]